MIAANDETLGLATARLALKVLFLLTALLLIAAGAFLVASGAWAIARSKKAIHNFRKDHPCPATGNKAASITKMFTQAKRIHSEVAGGTVGGILDPARLQ